MIKKLIFDWGNTIMVDFELPGPMYTWEKVSWVDGAENAIKSLSETYELYLATNAGASDTSGVIKALNRVGADKYFKKIFLAREVGYKKPEKQFFLSITKSLQVDPGECLMIGDNYEKDCIGAKAVGMKTVFFNAQHKKGVFNNADKVIENMEDLPLIIDRI